MLGYMVGMVYQKSLSGCLFYDFFGGNILKVDVLILVIELGLLLDYIGLYLEVEEYIVCIFGVEQSYMVMNGMLILNKIVGMYVVFVGSMLFIDCNCYKLLVYLLMMSDVVFFWLKLMCNVFGIFGGIFKCEFICDSIVCKVVEIVQV